ncbi:MAG: methyl-accepting chemotaxis protein [Magnetococcus sp. YQC-9]
MIRLQDIRLRTKLTGLLLLCGLIPLFILGWLRDHQSEQSRLTQTTTRLESVRGLASAEIKRHLAERRADLEILTQLASEQHHQARASLEALRDFKKERIETFFANQLQDLIQLAANPDFVKRVAAIDWLFRQGGRKSDDKHWRETVDGFIPWLHGRQAGFGVEDLYFISPLGDVVYTLNHRAELGGNVLQKPLKDGPLALAHRQALDASHIQEFQPYPQPENDRSAFIGVPVKKDGALIGSLLVRLSRGVLSQLLTSSGAPNTGEQLLLIDGEGAVTESGNVTGKPPSWTHAIQQAIQTGKKNGSTLIASGPAHPAVVVTWTPVKVKGMNWTIVAAKETGRIFTPQANEKRHWLQKFSESAGYFDLFLIHPDGEVFFSAARQADFGTNLLTGKFAGTNLGNLIQKVAKSGQAGLSDLLPYPPSDNQPAFFVAQPVNDSGQLLLITALQLAPDAITTLLHPLVQSTPYRLFLVGPDQKLRSDAFTDPANPTTATAFIGSPAAAVAAPEALKNGLAGESATLDTRRQDGKRVLSSYAPLVMDGFNWVLIAEAEWDEIITDSNNLPLLAAGILLILLLTLLGYRYLQRELFTPIEETAFTLNRMASGHFSTFGEGASRQDEFGAMNRSLATLSREVTQAGQRIHQATDPLSIRIRRLASQAMLISRESAVGSENLAEVRAAILESSRQVADETGRLITAQNRLVEEQLALLDRSEQSALLTQRAVAEGKQWIHEDTQALQQLQERTHRLREVVLELLKRSNAVRPNGEDSGKHGKHGRHGKEEPHTAEMLNRLAREMQNELVEIHRQIVDRLDAARISAATLDGMLPSVPMPQPTELTPLVALDHNPDRILSALDNLDELLKKNIGTSREIILAAKAVFDITTGPLKQATSYFAPAEPVLPDHPPAKEPLATERSRDPMGTTSRLTLDAVSASNTHDGSGSSPSL